jgi:hypothetical protein
LTDVQTQLLEWLETVANVRIHQTTGQSPKERFAKVHLRPLPQPIADCRETSQVYVHKDFAVRFDGNAYTVPPWLIGKKLILKADKTTVTVYHQQKTVATHQRSWRRKQRIQLPAHMEQVKKMKKRLWQDKQIALFSSLGQQARDFLQALVEANQPIKKNVSRLLCLKDQYGASSLIHAINKALLHHAYGAHYIENILYQEMTPQSHHPPVKLKDQELNHIRLSEPSLSDYDAYILKKKKEDKDD